MKKALTMDPGITWPPLPHLKQGMMSRVLSRTRELVRHVTSNHALPRSVTPR